MFHFVCGNVEHKLTICPISRLHLPKFAIASLGDHLEIGQGKAVQTLDKYCFNIIECSTSCVYPVENVAFTIWSSL